MKWKPWVTGLVPMSEREFWIREAIKFCVVAGVAVFISIVVIS